MMSLLACQRLDSGPGAEVAAFDRFAFMAMSISMYSLVVVMLRVRART